MKILDYRVSHETRFQIVQNRYIRGPAGVFRSPVLSHTSNLVSCDCPLYYATITSTRFLFEKLSSFEIAI